MAGISVKGDTGGRSARERSECERARMSGEAFTLDADGGQRAYRQGGRTRAAPAAPAAPVPADSRARTDAGCKPKGLAQAKRGGVPAGNKMATSRAGNRHQPRCLIMAEPVDKPVSCGGYPR